VRKDIQAHLLDFYGLKVSPDLISHVTDAVLDEVREWQSHLAKDGIPFVDAQIGGVKSRVRTRPTIKKMCRESKSLLMTQQ
jgi:transposase-like protein